MRKFTADFETNVSETDCRVWAYAIHEIGVDNFIYGNNIEDFLLWCNNKKENYIVYFHNLKFDGEYIISYLLNNGYECVKTKKERKDKTFSCLIGEMGQFYSIEVYFHVTKSKVQKVTFYDSYKIIAMSVEDIAKKFNLPIRKLKIDYKENRELGHILTKEEIDYIRNDVEIMARALEIMFKEELTHMTIGANALSYYRKINKYFNNQFPEIPFEIDKSIRQSYKGGFTYLNPLYKDKEVKDGIVLDVNSLYPSVMATCDLPFGVPIYFDGEYKYNPLYPLYIQQFSCSFKLKEGKIPTIQIKNDRFYIPNEYIESSKGDIVTLCLTNIDFELFLEQYDHSEIIYQGGYKFKAIDNMFIDYVKIWSDKKIQAKKDNNSALYQIAKLMMNSLYGKFSKNPIIISKYPVLDEEGIVRYKNYDVEIGKGLYIPLGSFVTSIARNKTIRTSQAIRDYTIKNYGEDYYIYSDTDSIHMKSLPEEELKKFVDIDDYRLGAWKLESRWNRGKFLRQKCYIENQEISEEDYLKAMSNEELTVTDKKLYSIEDNKYYRLTSTIAGLPKKLSKYVNFDNFSFGFGIYADELEKEHKLTYKHVKGGVMLVDTDFTIK